MSKIKFNTEFWKEIGSNRKTGIQTFKDKNQLRLCDVLATGILECINEKSSQVMFLDTDISPIKPSFEFSFSKIVKYYFGLRWRIFLTLCLLLFLALIPLVVYQVFVTEKQIVVAPKTGIPAFHPIAQTDLKNVLPLRAANEVGSDVPLIGRYTLKYLPENSLIVENDLLSTDLNKEMVNRIILQLPVKSENIASSVGANSKICLLFSPNPSAGKQVTIINDIILLGVEKKETGTILIVAFQNDKFKSIQDLIAISTVYVITS
ncbi:MAG: hypothetical protein ACR2MG_12100 [Pyrinomonadaceae bacterium]